MVSLTACASTKTEKETSSQLKKKIGIIQVVEHPSLNEIRESIINELKDKGFKDGENITIDYQNAQNDQSNLKAIAQKFVNGKYDLIIAIATPSAQAVVSQTKDIPILFSSVLDPIGAGIITNFEKPGGNVSGTSNAVSAEEVMNMANLIANGIKYNMWKINRKTSTADVSAINQQVASTLNGDLYINNDYASTKDYK
jgi:putative ABC transport system substrate-binding protein